MRPSECPRTHRLRSLLAQLLGRAGPRSVDAMTSRKGPSTDFVNPGEHWLPPESTSRSTRGAMPWRYRTAEAEEKAASADDSDEMDDPEPLQDDGADAAGAAATAGSRAPIAIASLPRPALFDLARSNAPLGAASHPRCLLGPRAAMTRRAAFAFDLASRPL